MNKVQNVKSYYVLKEVINTNNEWVCRAIHLKKALKNVMDKSKWIQYHSLRLIYFMPKLRMYISSRQIFQTSSDKTNMNTNFRCNIFFFSF